MGSLKKFFSGAKITNPLGTIDEGVAIALNLGDLGVPMLFVKTWRIFGCPLLEHLHVA